MKNNKTFDIIYVPSYEYISTSSYKPVAQPVSKRIKVKRKKLGLPTYWPTLNLFTFFITKLRDCIFVLIKQKSLGNLPKTWDFKRIQRYINDLRHENSLMRTMKQKQNSTHSLADSTVFWKYLITVPKTIFSMTHLYQKRHQSRKGCNSNANNVGVSNIFTNFDFFTFFLKNLGTLSRLCLIK